MGPTHLDSERWTDLNYTGGALAALLLIGTFFFLGHKSRNGIAAAIKAWYMSMKLDNKKPSAKVNSEQEKDNKE
ncbi:unnamed protein product [marine sediment metagenome]|uniref:Uncharacterized protein n=1 Tax=marine sediment metagenome TaxID=412755 RepID=X0XWM0_9ZZZZ